MSKSSPRASSLGSSRFGNAIRTQNEERAAIIPSIGEIGLNHFAPYLLNRVAARWNANMQEALKAYDLTTVKMRSLAVLSITSPLTINELSEFTVTEQSTMSRTLDAMEEQSLVRRIVRSDDLRVREVALTEDGRDAFAQFWPKMYELYSELFEGITETEYEGMVMTLHKLIKNLQKSES